MSGSNGDQIKSQNQSRRVRDTRGRKPAGTKEVTTDHTTTDLIGLRMTASMIEAVDDWRKEQPGAMSRSEAIRAFISFAIYAGPVLQTWLSDTELDERRRSIINDLLKKYHSERDAYKLDKKKR